MYLRSSSYPAIACLLGAALLGTAKAPCAQAMAVGDAAAAGPTTAATADENLRAFDLHLTQHRLVSERQVDAGAALAYAREIETTRAQGRLNADGELTARVRAVAQRLIPGTAAFRADAPGWAWEVNTVRSDELAAYCLPGGKIMVSSGLVGKLGLSDGELAAVIGHEMAHALRGHSRERVSRAYAQQLALAGVVVLTDVGSATDDGSPTGSGSPVSGFADTVASLTARLPHSREQESEADGIGLELMARAGFDPSAAITLWQKMSAVSAREPAPFAGAHPSSATRIADLQDLVLKMMPLYERSRT